MVSENGMEDDDIEICEDCDTDSDLDLEDICPLRDDAKVIFDGHTSGILCVDLDEKRNSVYTGGLDDKVIAWELSTGRVMSILNGHGESVTHLTVNATGSMIASGDLGGCVIIWERNNNQETWVKIHNIEASSIVGLAWIYSQNHEYLFLCDSVGTIQSWSAEDFLKGPVMYKYGKGCSCTKFCLVLNNEWSAVLYGETCGEHENCKNTSSLHLVHNGSDRTVKVDLKSKACVEDEDLDEGLGAAWSDKVMEQSHLLAIGDWNQFIVVTMTSQSYTAQCKLNTVEIKDGGLVDNIAFASQLNYLAFSTKNGIIGIYDLMKQSLRQTWKYSETMPIELRSSDCEEPISGVSQLCWSPTKPVFYTTGLDGRLCEWDGRSGPTGDIHTLWGYSGIVWDMRVSLDGGFIVAVSEDKTGRLFTV